MNITRITLILSLVIPVNGPAVDAADPTSTVRLDDGRVLHGAIREISPQRLLIQTDDEMVEVTADRVAAVDGGPLSPALLATRERLIVSTHYVTVSEDGSSELWTRNRTVNRGTEVITSLSWGAAEHELAMVRTMQAFDGFGNRLSHRLEPPTGDRGHHTVVVDLALPVPPGETVDLALRYHQAGTVKRDGRSCRLAFAGDFPDDRLYTRVVRLPPGAVVTDVSPPPLQRFTHDGMEHVVWRRYYPAGRRDTLAVEYQLPAGGSS
jgi:hypothetical protein